jgi:hypothetical protein
MSDQPAERPIRKGIRRAPNVATVFAAAAKAGLQVTGAVIKEGALELKFGQGAGPAGNTNEWDAEYGPASP